MYKCDNCEKEYEKYQSLGAHVLWCKGDKEKIKNKLYSMSKGKTLSESTKNLISEARKKYLKDNPDKIPYLLNHSHKESYPEKYFKSIFEKEGIEFVKEYRVGTYHLDFAILEYKIDIEIDGDQHYLDKKIIESDLKRNNFLEENGWDILRIKWSDYKKLSKDEKYKYISDIKEYINNLKQIKPVIEIVDKIKNKSECICGNQKSRRAKLCLNCHIKELDRKDLPTLDQLLNDVNTLGYCGTGRKYNVSDNAIRKWIKKLKK